MAMMDNKPDLTSRIFMSASKVSGLKKPYIRLFDCTDRIKIVRVKLYTWRGISIGAKHFNAEWEEEDNPIWYAKEKCWLHLYGDQHFEGERFKTECLSKENLLSELQIFAKQHSVAKENTHRIRISGLEKERRISSFLKMKVADLPDF